MAQLDINIGTNANDGTGDQLRDAFDKTNQNFTDLYDTLVADIYSGDATVVRVTAPVALIGQASDAPGMFAFDADSVYVCVAAYDGGTDIWIKLNTDATIDHNAILNVGSNDHTAIDAHIVAGSMHYLQSAISITESQISVKTITGIAVDHTLALVDARAMIRMENAAANTLTIPANGTTAFPIGTVIEVTAAGSGGTTIAILTDALFGVTALAQYDVVTLTKVGTTEWLSA